MVNTNRLKVELSEKGKVGKRLAEEIGKTPCSVGNQYSNSIQPNLHTLDKITKLLDVSTKDLLNENEKTMLSMNKTVSLEKLYNYVLNNEVVYQFCGELMEVANESEKENKDRLLGYFREANRIEIYMKHDRFVADNWEELTDWSTDDDMFFLLDGVGVLICIPKKEVFEQQLIAA